jgi:integrase
MWGDLVELAASTGLRRGELAALRWSDIDTKGRTIRVAHSVATTSKKDTGATWVLTPTKGRKIRRVPLTESAAGALARQYERASSTAPGSFVFSEDPTGLAPIPPDRVSKMLRTARDAAGVPSDVSPVHALRGFAATTIGSAVSAREAQEWMGHDSIVTTERYLAPVRDDEARAVAAIDAARRPKALAAPTVTA